MPPRRRGEAVRQRGAWSVCTRLAGSLAACTGARPLDASTPDGRGALNTEVAGHAAVVHLTSGETAGAGSLRFDAQGASWVDPETGQTRTAPASAVRLVRLPFPQRGALVGLTVGTAVGALAGAPALGEDDGGFGSVSRGAAFAVIVGTGALVGAAVGWARGRVGRVFRVLPSAPR